MMFFQHLLVAVATLALVSANTCSNVYPQLSCGSKFFYADSPSTSLQTECLELGCCWDPSSSVMCFVPPSAGYAVTDYSANADNTQINATLSLNQQSGVFGTDFDTIQVVVTRETSARTHIKMTPQGTNQFVIPDFIVPRPGGLYDPNQKKIPGSPESLIEIPNAGLFSLQVTRQSSGAKPGPDDIIFDLLSNLYFQSQYIQMSLNIPADVAASYGYGESTRKTQQLEQGSTYTLWNSDTASTIYNQSLYGSHPFVVQIKDNGKASGFLFMNSNAQQLTYTTDSVNGNMLNIQSAGGIIEMYVFSGPTPAFVVREFQKVVGFPAFVPYWSLGFHNCQYGYPNLDYVKEVVANYSAAQIPLETQWMDIDYMEDYLDFTFDPVNFPQQEVANFVDQLHSQGQRFVPIVDPGIYIKNPNYPAYSEGIAQDVFLKDYTGQNNYLGQVWPGPTYFPDWFSPQSYNWWENQLADYRKLVAYDGIWIDMNEVANFCNDNGAAQVCYLQDKTCDSQTTCCLNCTTPDPTNIYDFPPFTPAVDKRTLGGKTAAPSAVHLSDSGERYLEYDVHNFFGLMESTKTRQSLIQITNKRPFVLSRSTFLGSGVQTAHWTGDNAATWNDLRASIVTMNNMALFAIPMIGADICGFIGDTTEELCARWIEVGAFSPFSRDHNTLGAEPQPLYKWPSVAQAARNSLNMRYQLLSHLYTLMYLAHTFGNTVLNPMWMHYSYDPKTLSTDSQYMWGDSILFTPVLAEGATKVKGYFPQGMWYSLFDTSAFDHRMGSMYMTLNTPLTSTNAHVRGGAIIPMQQAAMTTPQVHASPFTLIVTFGGLIDLAEGALYMDDGEQLVLSNKLFVVYVAKHGELISKVLNDTYTLNTALLTQVQVWTPSSTAASCSASLLVDGESTPILPSSSSVLQGAGNTRITFNFNQDIAVNVATDFNMTWTCSDSQVESSSSSSSSLSAGAVAGVVVGAIIGVGVLGAAAYMYSSSKSSQLDDGYRLEEESANPLNKKI